MFFSLCCFEWQGEGLGVCVEVGKCSEHSTGDKTKKTVKNWGEFFFIP